MSDIASTESGKRRSNDGIGAVVAAFVIGFGLWMLLFGLTNTVNVLGPTDSATAVLVDKQESRRVRGSGDIIGTEAEYELRFETDSGEFTRTVSRDDFRRASVGDEVTIDIGRSGDVVRVDGPGYVLQNAGPILSGVIALAGLLWAAGTLWVVVRGPKGYVARSPIFLGSLALVLAVALVSVLG